MLYRSKFRLQGSYEFQLLKSRPSRTLTAVLPGAGYHTDLPVLYYISQWLAINQGHVLQARESSIPLDSVRDAFTEQVMYGHYEDYLIVSKSVGTQKTADWIHKDAILNNSRIIWLTPLLKNESLFQQMLNFKQQSLIIIGDRDGHYEPEKLRQLGALSNYHIHIAPNATHSLEYIDKGNVNASLTIMSSIIDSVKDFVHKTKAKKSLVGLVN